MIRRIFRRLFHRDRKWFHGPAKYEPRFRSALYAAANHHSVGFDNHAIDLQVVDVPAESANQDGPWFRNAQQMTVHGELHILKRGSRYRVLLAAPGARDHTIQDECDHIIRDYARIAQPAKHVVYARPT